MEYAGFWRRFFAILIDGLILAIFTNILHLILGTGSLSTIYIVNITIGIGFYVGFWTWRGQTPGKMMLGVKIVNTDGSPIGLGRAILRYIGYIISTIILLIGYFMIAWDGKKQGLHDKIAGTYVIRVDNQV